MSSSLATSYASAESSLNLGDRVSAIPRNCSCGKAVVIRKSLTSANPGRQFFVCPISSNHLFKWVDEAMLEEIELTTTILSDVREHLGKLEVERKQEREAVSAMIKEAQSLKSTMFKLEKDMEDVRAKARSYVHFKMTMLGCLVGVVFYCVLGSKCKTN